MILETLVTTRNADGSTNLAPMGVLVAGEQLALGTTLVLQPFHTSRTHANLSREQEAVVHVTDDVLLLAQATIGEANPPLVASNRVRVSRLRDCCRAFECHIDAEGIEPMGSNRSRYRATVYHVWEVRPFFGLNRAKFAVVEAAILVSRLGLLPAATIRSEWDRLVPLLEKTGGTSERAAFALLEQQVRERLRDEVDHGDSRPG